MKIGAVFTSDTPAVSSVSVSPATATVSKGQSLQLSATVVTTGFANKSVGWGVDETSEQAGVTISQDGKLFVPSDLTGVTTITVTAQSIYDSTKTGTATITVA